MTTSDKRRPHWIAGQTPWIRRELAQKGRARCMFCGDETVIMSTSDEQEDYGRVEVYCDSPECDARETAIIILRGEGAHRRADVRALDAVDRSAPFVEPTPSRSDPYFEHGSATAHEREMEEIANKRWTAENTSNPPTSRRISRASFRINVD